MGTGRQSSRKRKLVDKRIDDYLSKPPPVQCPTLAMIGDMEENYRNIFTTDERKKFSEDFKETSGVERKKG